MNLGLIFRTSRDFGELGDAESGRNLGDLDDDYANEFQRYARAMGGPCAAKVHAAGARRRRIADGRGDELCRNWAAIGYLSNASFTAPESDRGTTAKRAERSHIQGAAGRVPLAPCWRVLGGL